LLFFQQQLTRFFTELIVSNSTWVSATCPTALLHFTGVDEIDASHPPGWAGAIHSPGKQHLPLVSAF
jgi:hypothetical protein